MLDPKHAVVMIVCVLMPHVETTVCLHTHKHALQFKGGAKTDEEKKEELSASAAVAAAAATAGGRTQQEQLYVLSEAERSYTFSNMPSPGLVRTLYLDRGCAYSAALRTNAPPLPVSGEYTFPSSWCCEYLWRASRSN